MPDSHDTAPAPPRVCPSCGEERPASAFRSAHPRTHCDPCKEAKAKPRASSEAHVEVPPAEVARCRICGWPLAASRDEGCVEGDCSYRPSDPEEQQRLRERREALERGALDELKRKIDECLEADVIGREVLKRKIDEEIELAIVGPAPREERDGCCPVLGAPLHGATVRTRGVEMSARGAAAVSAVLRSSFALDELEAAIGWLRARGER